MLTSALEEGSEPGRRRALRSLTRWLLAALGCLLVGLGLVGLAVPGMPTTVFLLGASWAFAKSCPWLEERLLGGRLGASLRRFRETGGMPRRAKIGAITTMWGGIGVGLFTLSKAGAGPAGPTTVVALGLIGTYVLLRHVRTLGSDIARG